MDMLMELQLSYKPFDGENLSMQLAEECNEHNNHYE